MNVTFFNPKSNLNKVNVTQEYYERLRSRLKIKRAVGKKFVRLGRPHDGGYVRYQQRRFVGFGHGGARL